ncbi:hypothetical protein [Acetobacter sp. DsW_059]|uniref:hypothetical protein n=1 Tax=Acetobacter sp. DsW_059 TaxID=1670661 RepID=UPI000A3A04EE|nr:hypothetical protein [Acetobacter sp. DsW_059]OUJ09179.1 hypothetical protein HK25_12120 [Acetobacter sp. DsW_059]
MSEQTDSILVMQAHTLDEIENAMLLLMDQLYSHTDTEPQKADCVAWGDGLSWLIRSVSRVRTALQELAP